MTNAIAIKTPRAARGFSIVELMTAITIGLLILAGLSSVFVNSSNANRELRNTSEQIESGRYAIELMSQDIRHAGFYGELSVLPAVPAAEPDPCALPTAGAVSDTVNFALALPLQRINPAAIPAGCSGFLTVDNLQPGSDIVVVRRADTTALPVTCTTTAAVTAGTYYVQSTADAAEIQIGVAGSMDSTKNATLGAIANTATMLRRDFTQAVGTAPGTCGPAVAGQLPTIAAAVRKYLTRIYFVAPCSVPNAGGTLCTGASDDNGKPVPTLKRLELDPTGQFSIVPLTEGIEAIRVEYGIDNVPNAVDPGTGLIGDGMPDSYSNAPSAVDMGNTVAARLYVLARNTASTPGYIDDKTYAMGTATFTPATAVKSYRRHVYGAEMRIVNPSGRREIPR